MKSQKGLKSGFKENAHIFNEIQLIYLYFDTFEQIRRQLSNLFIKTFRANKDYLLTKYTLKLHHNSF